jgi:predicted dehydrogenase
VQNKIKCGVIGAGWWATFAHIPALLAHPNAELVAIQNDNLRDAKKIAHDFRIPIACTTASELLAIEGISAIVVSSSPNLHYKDAFAALGLGKHVLIEKPMTLTVAEAMTLVRIADEHDAQFLISCPWHHTAHAIEAQRLIGDGALGQIRMISVLMTNPIDELLRGANTQPTHGRPYMHPRAGTYSDPKVAGGGQIYAQVCHAAAYLTFLTGARPSEVFARFHNDGAALDIYDVLDLRMDDSSIVTIASTGATSLRRKDFEVRVFGTKGMLFLDLWRGRLEFVPLVGEPHVYPDLKEDGVYPHQAPAMNLIDSILNPLRNQSPATLGVAAMEVIEGATRSAKSGNNVLVSSLVEQPA